MCIVGTPWLQQIVLLGTLRLKKHLHILEMYITCYTLFASRSCIVSNQTVVPKCAKEVSQMSKLHQPTKKPERYSLYVVSVWLGV